MWMCVRVCVCVCVYVCMCVCVWERNENEMEKGTWSGEDKKNDKSLVQPRSCG